MNAPAEPEGQEWLRLEATSRLLESLGRILSGQKEWSLFCLHTLLTCGSSAASSRDDLAALCLKLTREEDISCMGPFFVRGLSSPAVQESIEKLLEWRIIAPFEEFAAEYMSLLNREESYCEDVRELFPHPGWTESREGLSLTREGMLLSAYFYHFISPPCTAYCGISSRGDTIILSNQELGTFPNWSGIQRRVSACLGRTLAFGPARIGSWWMPYSLVHARIYSESDLGNHDAFPCP